MTPARLSLSLLSLTFIAACAARTPPSPPRDVLAESLTHLRAGCYRCLEEGLSLLEGRTDPPARQRAFELALLLAARAKELGLAEAPWVERARALAGVLPPAAAANEFLALVDGLRRDPAGLDRNADFEQRAVVVVQHVPAWLAAIEASSAAVEVKSYFALAATCGFFMSKPREAAAARARTLASGVPLLEYALGTCSTGAEEPRLRRALDAEPRFDDAAYPLARLLTNRLAVNRPDHDPAALFARARQAFPASAAIAYTEATYYRARREWDRAAKGFEATLALVPAHHDARLGLVVAQSNLGRHDEAMAGATSLIVENKWLVGDAFYWRAWNEFTLGRLDESERDVEQAKKQLRWSAVWVLSGLVQWRKQRPAVAETELMQAVKMSSDDCEAASYLGSVRAELRKWLPAVEAFTHAETCREREVTMLRATLDDLIAHDAPEAAITSQRASLAAAEQDVAEMAYNRGVMLANAGDVASARPHIERAGRHPTLQSKAAELLRRLGIQ